VQIERNLLYHYLSDLEAHQAKLREGGDQDTTDLKHLDLLLGFMQSTYASTKDRLAPLLKDRKITYDLLWALFKPKSAIFTTFLDTAKPSCFRYDSGEETTTSNGTAYFRLECRFLDYDGHVFGEVSTALAIRKFRGAKRIETLEVFPLAYHEDRTSMRTQLLRCGRRFATLMGVYHVQYCGNAFYVQNGEVIEVHVNSRIMVDAARFREVNPNYARPRIDGLAKQDTSSEGWLILGSDKQSDEVKSNGLDPEEMQEDDLLICSPTVFGWSFGNKQWCKHIALLQFNVEVTNDL